MKTKPTTNLGISLDAETVAVFREMSASSGVPVEHLLAGAAVNVAGMASEPEFRAKLAEDSRAFAERLRAESREFWQQNPQKQGRKAYAVKLDPDAEAVILAHCREFGVAPAAVIGALASHDAENSLSARADASVRDITTIQTLQFQLHGCRIPREQKNEAPSAVAA